MKRLFTALIIALSSFWATWLWAQSGVPSTKAGVNAVINSNFPDNTTGSITPFLLRQGLFDIVSSMQQYGCVHALTGTTYTALSTDYGCLLTFSNSNPMTLNLPAGPTINPFNIFVSNYGGGNLNIVPAAGTIAGLPNLTLGSGAGLWIVNDGTNWQIFRGSGSGAGGILIGEAVNGSAPGGLLYNTTTNLLADDGPFIVSTFPPLLSNGQWSIGSTTSGGAILIGQGSTNDIQLEYSVGTIVMAVPTSSGFINMPGLQTGGSIASSICATATGTLIANASSNCFAGTGSPGGSNTQVQFNTNGVFGGISGVTSDSAGLGINTATIATLTGGSARFTVLASGGTAQFNTFTGPILVLTGNLTGTTAQFSGAVTGTTAQFQTYTGSTLNLTGNLTGTTAQFSGAVTGTTAQYQTRTGATLNLTSNLTGTTAQFSGAITGTTSQMQTRTGATLNLTGNLTGTTAQFSGAVTGTTAVFQTMTIGSLTPTGPNCLQETGGVLQATNAACSAAAGTPGGVSTNIQVNSGSTFGGDNGLLYAGQGVGNGVTMAQGTITTNVKALNITANWNTSAVVFDAPLFMNISAASGAAANSVLTDIQRDSNSILKVFAGRSSGTVDAQLVSIGNSGTAGSFGTLHLTLVGTASTWGVFNDGAGWVMSQQNNHNSIRWGDTMRMQQAAGLDWVSSNDPSTGTADIVLYRDTGAGILGMANGSTNSTTLRVYNTTDQTRTNTVPTNYERAIVDWKLLTSTLSIGTQNGGTGVGRNMQVVISGTTQALFATTSVNVQTSLNVPNIAQLAANTTGYVCWTTGTGAISEDSVTCLSSLRSLKKDIAPFSGATTELMALKPSTFQWRNPADRNQNGPQLGFIAEDVAMVDSRLSTHTSDGNLRGWQEPGMIALLVRGFQEQQQEIADLKAQLRGLGR